MLVYPVFNHGCLYVAFSKVRSRNDLKVFFIALDDMASSMTANVIFKEVFYKIITIGTLVY